MKTVLRSPLLAISVISTVLFGLALIGIGIASAIANSGHFGIGVALLLCGYGVILIVIAWLVTKGYRWALGLVVASALLQACVVGSFLTTTDRAQFIGSLIVAPIVLATVVSSVWAIGRGELDRVFGGEAPAE